MDYCLEMSRMILEAKQEDNLNELARMDRESDYILTCLEAMEIIDGLDVLTEAAKGPSLWEKIKEFFKNLFSVFSSKAKKLVDYDRKWLDTNAGKLKNMSTDGITIKMIPYWNTSFDKIKSEVDRTKRQLFDAIKKADTKAVINGDSGSKFVILSNTEDENGSVAEGLKNLFRTGNVKTPTEKELKGDSIQKYIPMFIDYCYDYEKSVVPYIRNLMSSIDTETKTIENRMSQVKESYSILENCNYYDTELKFCRGSEILMEAEVKKDNKTSPTAVTVEKDEKKEEQNKDGDKKDDKFYEKTTSKELKFLKDGLTALKTLVTAVMTALEERYTAYMKVLKALMSNGGKDTKEDNQFDEDKKSKPGKGETPVNNPNGNNNPKKKKKKK